MKKKLKSLIAKRFAEKYFENQNKIKYGDETANFHNKGVARVSFN